MQLPFADALCYALFTITVTASCVRAETDHTQDVAVKTNSKIAKRETTLLIDNYPTESKIKLPKVIFRRLSRYPPYKKIKQNGHGPTRYGTIKKKNFHSHRLNYQQGQVKNKKNRVPQKLRFSPQSAKNYRKTRPKTQNTKVNKDKHKANHSSNTHRDKIPYRIRERHPYRTTEPTGFGEPPVNIHEPGGSYQNREPLVDSYGAPLSKKPTPTAIDTAYGHNLMAEEEGKNEEYGGNHNNYNYYEMKQNIYEPDSAFTKNHFSYITSGKTNDNTRFQNDDSHASFYFPKISKDKVKNPHPKQYPKKEKPYHYKHHSIKYNDPSNYASEGSLLEQDDGDYHMVVGGKYAEPPARYIPKYLQHNLFDDDYDSFEKQGPDSEGSVVSSYVNYKNSNMAFSPQNLNDAFGTLMDS